MAPIKDPKLIKNKMKREEMSRKAKKEKGQAKLQKRLALAKQESNDPAAKKVRDTLFVTTHTVFMQRTEKTGGERTENA